MLSLYFGALVFGGVLLGASILGGAGDHAIGDHGGDAADAHGFHDGPLAPILSVRFWLFGITFFGLTGAIAALAGAGGVAVPLAAAAVGLTSGYGATRAIGGLSRRPLGLVANASAHVGREGRLLLPVAKHQRGKLRVNINGVAVDLLAETDGDAVLPAGSSALIVGLRGNVVIIEPSEPLDRLPSAKEPA